MKLLIRAICLLLLCAGLVPHASAQHRLKDGIQALTSRAVFHQEDGHHFTLREWLKSNDGKHQDNVRLVAIALDISLGLVGMHRLYLGTDIKVAVFYTLTMGGGCVLWLVDLGLLIFSKDIEKYLDNPHLFMWME